MSTTASFLLVSNIASSYLTIAGHQIARAANEGYTCDGIEFVTRGISENEKQVERRAVYCGTPRNYWNLGGHKGQGPTWIY